MLQKHHYLVAAFLGTSASLAIASSKLVYMHEEGETKRIVIANSDGSEPQPLSPANTWGLYPDISTDGRYVAYSGGTGARQLGIVTQDLATGILEQWTPQDGQYLHADLSGNGRFLAFSGPVGVNGGQRVAVIDLLAERQRLALASPPVADTRVYQPVLHVVDSAYPSYFPALSSSGAFVIYERSQGDTKVLVKRDLVTGDEIDVTPATGYAMAPALSFDDRYVAYSAKLDGRWDLFVRDLWSDEVRQITNDAALNYAPTFRADGGLIFAGDHRGHFELYEVPASALVDGTYSVRPLLLGDGDHYAPAVSGEINYNLGSKRAIPAPARSSFGAIAHHGKVYVVGGHQGPEHTYPRESFMDRLDIYDPATDTWSAGAPLSLARHGFSLAAQGPYIYAFGGFAFSAEHQPHWKSVDLIERYDTVNNRWEVIGHLEHPRSSNAVAQVGDQVYLLGGWDSTPQSIDDAEGRFHDTIEVFDLTRETISTSAVRLPNPLRRALSSVVYGDEVILVGGLGVGANHFDLLRQVTAFNTRTQTWRELPSLPFATFAPAAGILNGELYVFGGMFKVGDMTYEYVDHIYGLALNGGAWRHTGRYLTELKGFSQVVDLSTDTLGILGGHTYEGDEDHPVATFETFGIPDDE